MKKLVLLLLCLILTLSLCSCKESTEDKIARLEKESEAAWERAREAQAEVDFLESIFGK